MRTVVAVVMLVSVLFVGVVAMSESAQQVEPEINTTAGNQSYDVAHEVFSGTVQSGGVGVVWFGIAAVVLVALGWLVGASRGGGR